VLDNPKWCCVSETERDLIAADIESTGEPEPTPRKLLIPCCSLLIPCCSLLIPCCSHCGSVPCGSSVPYSTRTSARYVDGRRVNRCVYLCVREYCSVQLLLLQDDHAMHSSSTACGFLGETNHIDRCTSSPESSSRRGMSQRK
jgi:hypothetical protein